ncbi:glycosyltransferase family 2 protein [Geomonas subterranea]|uniref:Glycosyltransferase family 2 protein n=1 Tax=Geomonas subterranea TaxID=2847989 RepID=A0ABX8LAS2_9BACT|nr:glycosyltransferase family 2 protein [Geomonas subterranea]QXE89077.1 glycosyltransferase family 2 protein [Geomonas subterranea]QXM08805.1 glycosyltransferase family 2 protein [Geomonas subterranea]
MPLISIVIPVFNAETTIAPLCQALVSHLKDHYRLEIVLVNDYSRDGSDAVCRQLHVASPETVTYLSLSRNFGEHNAVMAGLNQARGDYVVVMDDDFQNPPAEVPKLLAEIAKGYDVVYCQYPKKSDSWFRNLGSYLNGTVARVTLDKPANLYLSSFKVMNRFLVDQLVAHKSPNVYLDALVLRSTRNIGTVEVRHDARREGRSGYTVKKLIDLWGNVFVSYSLIPLRLLAIAGAILTLSGIYSVSVMLIRGWLPMLNDPSDIQSLNSITMFFRGVQLLATGVVGEYVGRIYLKLNQEPQFIVRETWAARRDRNGG